MDHDVDAHRLREWLAASRGRADLLLRVRHRSVMGAAFDPSDERLRQPGIETASQLGRRLEQMTKRGLLRQGAGGVSLTEVGSLIANEIVGQRSTPRPQLSPPALVVERGLWPVPRLVRAMLRAAMLEGYYLAAVRAEEAAWARYFDGAWRLSVQAGRSWVAGSPGSPPDIDRALATLEGFAPNDPSALDELAEQLLRHAPQRRD